MKQYIFYTFLFSCVIGITNAQVIIGDSIAGVPAILQIGAKNKGLLIPRFSIPDFSESSPVNNPKTGLLAINTNVISGEGLVQWNGIKWQRIADNKDVNNYITDLGVERVYFVGTTSSQKTPVKSDVKLEMNTLILNNGTVSNNGYIVPTTGLYEIATNWSASISDITNSYLILKLNSNGILVTESTFSRAKALTNLGIKNIYLGEFNEGDIITYSIYRSAGSSFSSSASIYIKKID